MPIDENKMIIALQDLGVIKQQVESHECSIVKIFDRLGANETFSSITNTSVGQIKESLAEFKGQQSEANKNLLAEIGKLKDKPGQRWDSLMLVIVTAVASGLITKFLF